MADTHCTASKSGRHQPTHRRHGDPLLSECDACGAAISRRHRRSAWWEATTAGKVIDLMEALKQSLAPRSTPESQTP